MATRQQRKRKKTFDNLIELVKQQCGDNKIYLDQVDEYMIYFDNLHHLNKLLLDETIETKSYSEILKEKRQVTKEMRSILTFLNLQPTESADDDGLSL